MPLLTQFVPDSLSMCVVLSVGRYGEAQHDDDRAASLPALPPGKLRPVDDTGDFKTSSFLKQDVIDKIELPESSVQVVEVICTENGEVSSLSMSHEH